MASLFVSGAVAPDLVWAYSNGPILSNDHSGDPGDSHSTTVNYSKSTNPFIANVTSVHIGGRPWDDGKPCTHKEKWRTENLEYKRWDSDKNKWVLVKKKSSKHYTQSSTDRLTYYYDNERVRLTDGALVKHRNGYQHTFWCVKSKTVSWEGSSLHFHYLE